MCDALVDLIDASSGDANGDIIIGDDSSFTNELAELQFSSPAAFGDAGAAPSSTTGVADANTITDDPSATGHATNPATHVALRDKGNNIVLVGTVGTTAWPDFELTLNDTLITASDVVSITSMTITVPAS